MSSVPSRVVKLIETFDRIAKALHSQQYNETRIRREFIDPFFEELGWDVTNKAANAHIYEEGRSLGPSGDYYSGHMLD